MFKQKNSFVYVSIAAATVLWACLHVFILLPEFNSAINPNWQSTLTAIPLALVVVSFLTVFLIFSVRHSFAFLTTMESISFAAKTAAIFGITAIASSMFVNTEMGWSISDQRELAKEIVTKKAHEIEGALSNANVAINALGIVINLSAGDQSHFDAAAAALLPSISGIDSIQVNSLSGLAWAYPNQAKDVLVANNLASIATGQALLTDAQQSLTVPVTLGQGRAGVLVNEPVFVEKRYWGVISAVMSLDALLDAVDISEIESQGYHWSISKGQADRDRLQRFAGSNLRGLGHPVSHIIALPGGAWVMEFLPITGWLPPQYSLVGVLFTALASLLAAVIAFKNFALPLLLIEVVRTKTERLADDQMLLDQTQVMSKTGSWKFDLINVQFFSSKQLHNLFEGYDFESPVNAVQHGEKYSVELKRLRRIERKLCDNEVHDVEIQIQGVMGKKWIRETAVLQYDDDLRPIAIIGACQDVTAQKAAQEAIRSSEDRMDMALKGAGLGAWEMTFQDQILVCDVRCFEMLGYEKPHNTNVLNQFEELLYPGDFDHINVVMRTHVKGSLPVFNVDIRAKHSNGDWTWLRCTGRTFNTNPMGKPTRALGTVQDITAQKINEQRLNTLSRAIENSPVATMVTDATGKIEYVNPMFSALTYYFPKDVIGQNPRIFQSGKTNNAQYEKLWLALNAGLAWTGELWNRRKDGTEMLELLSITPVTNEHNAVVNFVAVKQDITQTRQTEQMFWQQAHFDALTGLANRVLCKESAGAAFRRAAISGDRVAILFLDLNDFKDTNDAHGHNAGDRVLVHLGRRLKRCVRDTDVAARIGGDEFALILEGLHSEDEVSTIVDNIHNSISSHPVMVKSASGNPVKVSIHASIGVAIYPLHGKTFEHLLNRADYAMYSKKRLKKETIKVV